MPLEPGARWILIAEDDANIIALLTTRLGLAGYQTLKARDGWEAIDAVHSLKPAGLLLDVNMPRLDGFGVLQVLKGNHAVRHVPVMMITARNASDDIQRALRLGASDYLTKPFSDAVLLARLARLLRPRAPSPPLKPSVLI